MGITGMLGPASFTVIFAVSIGSLRDWHVPGARVPGGGGAARDGGGIGWMVTKYA